MAKLGKKCEKKCPKRFQEVFLRVTCVYISLPWICLFGNADYIIIKCRCEGGAMCIPLVAFTYGREEACIGLINCVPGIFISSPTIDGGILVPVPVLLNAVYSS